jgi:DNA-binding NarL/FixJ family response regulator
VEDEPLIAVGIQDLLVGAGFDIAGMAARLPSALKLVQSTDCDVAIIDANLAGTSASPVAEVLAARSVPFIVLSGYSREQLREKFYGGIFVQKPYQGPQLLGELEKILAVRSRI